MEGENLSELFFTNSWYFPQIIFHWKEGRSGESIGPRCAWPVSLELVKQPGDEPVRITRITETIHPSCGTLRDYQPI